MNVRYSTLVLISLMALAPAAPAQADSMFGVRGGYYTDAESPFLGVEGLIPVSGRVFFNPNAEYVFVDGGDYFTVNGDFHYDLPTRGRAMIWLGAGLGLSKIDPEGAFEGETDVIANVLAGIGARTGSVIPYAQAKLILQDDTELVIGFGLRF